MRTRRRSPLHDVTPGPPTKPHKPPHAQTALAKQHLLMSTAKPLPALTPVLLTERFFHSADPPSPSTQPAAQSTPVPRARRPQRPIHIDIKPPILASKRTPSPLPPSSPPSTSEFDYVLPSDALHAPRPHVHVREPSIADENDERNENVADGATDKENVEPDALPEDDPFGFLAAERRLKVLRAANATARPARTPFGVLALPDSDEDLYADADTANTPGHASDEDKENIPAAPAYDSEEDMYAEDKENLPIQPPPYDSDEDMYTDEKETVMDDGNAGMDADKENESSSSAAYEPLRTPHKPRSAKKRTPLSAHVLSLSSTPGSDNDLEMHTSTGLRLPAMDLRVLEESPSPIRRASLGEVLHDIHEHESENQNGHKKRVRPSSPTPRPARKRARREDVKDEEMDPLVFSRNLEKLLPKRPVRRPARQSNAGAREKEDAGRRKQGVVKGKETRLRGRPRKVVETKPDDTDESGEVSEEESEEEKDEAEEEPPRRVTRATSRKGKENADAGKDKRASTKSKGASNGKDATATKAKNTGTTDKTNSVATASGKGKDTAIAKGTRATIAKGKSTTARKGKTAATAKRSTIVKPKKLSAKSKGKQRAGEDEEFINPDEDEEARKARRARLEYFRRLDDYSVEKENVYVI